MNGKNINSVVDTLSGVYNGVKYGVSAGILMPNALCTLYRIAKDKIISGKFNLPKTEEGQLAFVISLSAGILGTIVPQVLFYRENPEFLPLIAAAQFGSYLAERKKKNKDSL